MFHSVSVCVVFPAANRAYPSSWYESGLVYYCVVFFSLIRLYGELSAFRTRRKTSSSSLICFFHSQIFFLNCRHFFTSFALAAILNDDNNNNNNCEWKRNKKPLWPGRTMMTGGSLPLLNNKRVKVSNCSLNPCSGSKV